MNYLIVFLCAVAIDVAYTRWMLHVSHGDRWQAVLASMCIGGAGLVGVTSVVHDRWLAVPYLAGLGVGTALGMVKR